MMYAEFKACYEALGQAMWLKNFIPDLIVVDNINKPPTIYCDNKVAVFFSHNNKSSETAKHIDLRYLIVRERVQDHTINFEHIGTKEMFADPIIKVLPSNIFEEHVTNMGLLESL
jgi:hypothetical protein